MTVVWTEPAEIRLREIFDYHKTVAGTRTAQKIVKKIVEHSRILAQNPQAGPCEGLLKDRPQEFRYLVQGNYKILYWITNEQVLISSVFDCRQNPIKMKEEIAGQ